MTQIYVASCIKYLRRIKRILKNQQAKNSSRKVDARTEQDRSLTTRIQEFSYEPHFVHALGYCHDEPRKDLHQTKLEEHYCIKYYCRQKPQDFL